MKAAQLRQTILQAAVQGKLVPQNPQDEPAERLLQKIKQKREALLIENYPNPNEANCQIKKQKHQLLPAELSELPKGWAWTTLLAASLIIVDCHNKTAPYTKNGIPLIRTSNIRNGKFVSADLKYVDNETYKKWSSRCYPEPGDIIITREAPMGEVCIIPERSKWCLGQRTMLIRLVPETIVKDYIFYFLQSPCMMEYVQDKPVGLTVKHLRVGGVETMLLPLPPLNEQYKIVSKVNELMLLCDEFEAAEKELDALESNLAEYLPKSILQAAVQGKLVPQNIHDEPASELLKCIQTEKTQLAKEGKIKKEKPLPPISEDEIPYELPNGWEWCRLNELCEYIQRGRSPKYSEKTQIPVLSQKCVQWEGVSLEKAKFIEPDSISAYGEERYIKNGDLLWNSTGHGTLGRIAQVKGINREYPIVVADSHVTVIRPFRDFVSSEYLLSWFSSPSVQDEIVGKSSGSTNQIELATATIKNYCVPLPPLAEQQRIVAKVDELMALCGQLKNIDASALSPLPAMQKELPLQARPVAVEPEERYGIAARGELDEKVSAAHRKARQIVFEDDDA